MEKETEKESKTEVTPEDAKSIAQEMAKTFASEMVASMKKEKEEERKIVPDKVIKSNMVITQKDVPVGEFKSKHEMEVFARSFVPKYLLEKFNNEKALTTYGNIGTDADGGSLDPVQAQGILARSVDNYPSHIEDTLQVPIYNSVGTFIDQTSDVTAYMNTETQAGTESKAGYTTRTVTQKKIMCLAPIANEVFRFASLGDIANLTLASMGRAISKKQQHLIFIADGTADTTDGSITGLIPTVQAVTNNSTIYHVNGEGWDAISNTDISQIVARVSSWADPSKFAWYCHPNQWGVLEGIARTLHGNSYLVQTGQRPVPYLYGYPVKFTNLMQSNFGDGEIGLIFGDLSGAVATGSTGQTYIDVSDSFYFSQDTTVLRGIKHIGVNVYQPGTNGTTTSVIAVQYNLAS